MRFIQIEQDEFTNKPLSISLLFGIKTFQNDLLTEYVSNYFSESFSHQALLNTEVKSKDQLNSYDKEFIALKYLIISTLYEVDIETPWHKQITDEVLSLHGWDSMNEFKDYLVSHSPQCNIE